MSIAEGLPRDESLDSSVSKARAAVTVCDGRRGDAAYAAAKAEQAMGHLGFDGGLAKAIKDDLRTILDPTWRKSVSQTGWA